MTKQQDKESAIKLQEKIANLLNQRKHEDAFEELKKHVTLFESEGGNNLYLLAEIAGSFISLGGESNDVEAVNIGISLFLKNKEIFESVVSEDSIFYCLGNGFQARYKIASATEENFFPTPDKVKNSLFEAKQSYQKAYELIDFSNMDELSIQILVNLGVNLNQSGRVVEALQLFDMALSIRPSFPQALLSKAESLIYLFKVSKCDLSVSLFADIYRLLSLVKQDEVFSDEIQESIRKDMSTSVDFLALYDYSVDGIADEFLLNQIEYQNHPENIRFFLDNFLSLSEHGLYCKCNRAKVDDLAIGFPGFVSCNPKTFKLEILNNRLKSEFSLARQMYFDYLNHEQPDNIHYEKVIAGIVDGINYELLRVSLRLCFGILDKIAEGICLLFDLEKNKGENIYFESFWNPKQSAGRWKKINAAKNIHLTALYSIAFDLNRKNGEYGYFKKWRNRLEHGLFTLTDESYKNKAWDNMNFAEITSVLDFEKKALHLLQLTRSAIFSFVLCAREEMIMK